MNLQRQTLREHIQSSLLVPAIAAAEQNNAAAKALTPGVDDDVGLRQ